MSYFAAKKSRESIPRHASQRPLIVRPIACERVGTIKEPHPSRRERVAMGLEALMGNEEVAREAEVGGWSGNRGRVRMAFSGEPLCGSTLHRSTSLLLHIPEGIRGYDRFSRWLVNY